MEGPTCLPLRNILECRYMNSSDIQCSKQKRLLHIVQRPTNVSETFLIDINSEHPSQLRTRTSTSSENSHIQITAPLHSEASYASLKSLEAVPCDTATNFWLSLAGWAVTEFLLCPPLWESPGVLQSPRSAVNAMSVGGRQVRSEDRGGHLSLSVP